MQSTVNGILLEILKKHGIRHIFGLPAAQLGHVMDGASRDDYFTYATTRHEEAAGHMAHAVARVTGEMAVCFGTVGPGATNLVPGVAAAWADNVPMLVLTPNNQLDRIDPGKDLLQNADQIALFRPITKWNAQIRSPERAPELIERAIYEARSGRPGPVHLDIPCDIGSAPCEYELASTPLIEPPRPVPTPMQIERVVEALSKARRPLLLAGGGVARSGAMAGFRKLVSRTGFAATTTLMGRGIVEADCAGHVGSGGVIAGPVAIKAAQEADLVLAIGCKFSTWTPINKPPRYPVPAGQRIIQIDIDYQALGKNTPISTGLVGDARETLALINQALDGRRLHADEDWVRSLSEAYQAYRAQVNEIADARYTDEKQIYNLAYACRAVAGLLPEDAIIAVDGGQTCEWAHTFIHPSHPQKIIGTPGMGHLGCGLPFAIAAKLARPQSPVVCVTGDGSLGLTIQELETAVRYGTPVVIFVMNDSHWGMYRPVGEVLYGNANFGTALTRMNYGRIAEGFGCYGERVTDLEQLPAAYRRAVDSGRPAVIDIPVDFTPHPIDEFWLDVVLHGVRFPALQQGSGNGL